MKRFALLAALAAAVALAGTALAGNKLAHQQISGTDTDPDFCGTGQVVNLSYSGVENLFANGNSTGQMKTTYTNPATGLSVIVSSAGPVGVTLVSDEGGGYTYVVTYRGQQEQIKLPKGQVLSKDAGYLTFYDHYDAAGNYLGTDVVEHGQHPEADSNFALFCSVVPKALGLS